MPRRLVPDGFVGYVRVSTESLMDEGHGLKSQTLALKEYAVGQCLDIVIVPASEPGHGPIIGRPRFLEAIQQARDRGWKLLVTNPSRLSRDVDHLKHINLRETPVWILDEGRISKRQLIEGVKVAQQELQQLRSDGSLGAKRRSSGFRTEEAKANAQFGRLAGAKANGDRAFRNRLRIQDFILQNPMSAQLTRKQFVDALNATGILNCVSEGKKTFKPWTVQSLRPVRKDVVEQIALDSEPDDTFMG
jgi:hypothetical protein